MLCLSFLARFIVARGPFACAAIASVAALAAPSAAHADAPIAPALATPTAHAYVEAELHAIVKALPAEARARVTGVYVAFEANPNDANALAACDDDGDYVIAITDAMITLVDSIAQAQASDEIAGTHKRDEYAAFLAKDQTRGARLLPPPPGFFGDPRELRDPRVAERARLRMRGAIDGLLAHELAHAIAGAIVCPHPTATRERGDTQWTRAEAQAASDGASKLYTPPHVVAADAAATTMLLAAHEDAGDRRQTNGEDGYIALLAFFDQVPGAAYARVHDAPLGAASAIRAQVVRAAASAGGAPSGTSTDGDASKKH